MHEGNSTDWERVRGAVEMDPSIAYLNTGTSGLIPKAVHLASIEYRTLMHHNPTRYVWRANAEHLWNSRCRLARHLGSTPDRILFFQNISHAINTFCLSVDLPAGAEIVLSDHEYGAMRWAWERAAQRNGWRLKTAVLPIHSESSQEYVDAVESCISPRTKLVYLSHVLYTTGHVLPIRHICKSMQAKKILTFVDGAHAPGMLSLHLHDLGADFYAANLHKWFMSPVGAAFLYVAHGNERHLQPWQVSWGYRDDRTDPNACDEFGSTPFIRQFELEGTRDITPWLLVPMNCDFLESIGYDSIRSRHFDLSNMLREQMNANGELECVTPQAPELRGGLTAFRLPTGVDGQALRKKLWIDYKIEINVVELNDQQYLRASTHVYNAPHEIEKLARAVKELLK